jgi:hypothetical protein
LGSAAERRAATEAVAGRVASEDVGRTLIMKGI